MQALSLVVERQRQEDLEFNIILLYITNVKTVWVT